jgi:hypothetical protein
MNSPCPFILLEVLFRIDTGKHINGRDNTLTLHPGANDIVDYLTSTIEIPGLVDFDRISFQVVLT